MRRRASPGTRSPTAWRRSTAASPADPARNLVTFRASESFPAGWQTKCGSRCGASRTHSPSEPDMKRALFASTAAALLALAACDHPNNPRVVTTDGFGSNSLDVYTVVSSGRNGWSIDGGELIGTGPVTHSLLLWNSVVFDNGWVESVSRRADDVGLVIRRVYYSNYYLLAFRDDGAPSWLGSKNLEIMRRSGGTFTSLLSVDVVWPRNTIHK